jgi:O-antigen ligase/cytochrome c-type biogenesis protein CcmH/NrfG
MLQATLLVPVVLVPGFFFPYVTVRAVYFRVLVEAAVAILLYLVLRREVVVDVRRDAAFWALLAWVGVNALAAAAGVAPMRSIFGDHERMGGVWFWVHILAFYVALRTFMRAADWWRFLRAAVLLAAIVTVYGILRYKFALGNFPILGIEAGVTIGNQGLLASYLLANIALSAILALRSTGYVRYGYITLGALLVAGLLLSGNRSSTIALFLGGGTALVGHAAWSNSLRGWRAFVVLLLLAMVAMLPFATRGSWAAPVTSRVRVLERLARGVDSSRVIQWRAAVDGIRDRPLLGVGPENYQIIWSRYYHPEMYRFVGDSRWDRAHNAYLEAFATAGVFGFLSLLAVFLSLGWVAHSAARRNRGENGAARDFARPAVEAVAIGFFAAYAFYLLFWFFDLNTTMLWISLAAFLASRRAGVPLIAFGARREDRWQTSVVIAAVAVAFAAVIYVHGFETLRMARTLARVQQPGSSELLLRNYEAVFASPAPVTQHAFPMYAAHLASLRSRFPEIRTDMASAALFDRAFILALKEFERQGRQDPHNERILVQHARVLMLGAYYYGSPRLYESALAKLQRAVELAPRRITTRLVLGTAYLNANQAERALEIFRQAYDVYPPLGQTHSYLASAHAQLGRYDSAATWLRSAMANGYSPDGALVRSVARELMAAGKADAGADLTWDYLRGKAGTPFLWGAGVGEPSADKAELAALAADFFSAAGQPAKAAVIRDAAPALCTRPMPLASLAAAALDRERVEHAPNCREPWRLAVAF